MLSNLLSNSMKHGALDRNNPVSARRLYSSIWDVFRIKTDRSHGRRLFKARPVLDTGGIQLLPVEELALNAVEAGAQGAQRGQEWFLERAPELKAAPNSPQL